MTEAAAKQIFSPHAAFSRLREMDIDPDYPFNAASDNDTSLVRWLTRLAKDTNNGRRSLLQPDNDIISAILAIGDTAPNAKSLIDTISHRLQATKNAGVAFSLPPILLLGPAGYGKTHVAIQTAKTLGTEYIEVAMSNASGAAPFSGADQTWKHPRIGLVAKALIEGTSASPIILLDEVDKPFAIAHDQPLDSLHSLLEPEQAKRFRDDFLSLEFDASSVIWFATANSLDPIPPTIQDRFLILEIPAPDADEMKTIIGQIANDIAQSYNGWFCHNGVDEEILVLLAALHPRRVKQILSHAYAVCAAAASHRLKIDHVKTAMRTFSARPQKQRAGFI